MDSFHPDSEFVQLRRSRLRELGLNGLNRLLTGQETTLPPGRYDKAIGWVTVGSSGIVTEIVSIDLPMPSPGAELPTHLAAAQEERLAAVQTIKDRLSAQTAVELPKA